MAETRKLAAILVVGAARESRRQHRLKELPRDPD